MDSGFKKVAFIRNIQAHVCLDGHQCGFRTMAEFKKHLAQAHRGEGVSEKSQRDLEAEVQGQEPLSPFEEKQCAEYWKYYGADGARKDGKFPDETMPTLPVMKVVKLKQCTECFAIIANEQKISTHKKKCQAELRDVFAQCIKGGNANKYFRVASEKCGVENWMEQKMCQTFSHGSSVLETAQLKEMGALASQLCFEEHLKNFGLSGMEAWKMLRADEDVLPRSMSANMYRAVLQYLNRARDIGSRNVFVKTHTFLGQSIHMKITPATVENYCRVLCLVMTFLVNMVGDGMRRTGQSSKEALPLHPDTAAKVQKLMDIDFNVRQCSKSVMVPLHCIFMSLFLNSHPGHIETIPIFVACYSVMMDEEEAGLFHFATSQDLSHMLAAVLHLANCVVVHEVYGDNWFGESQCAESSNSPRSNSKWEKIEALEKEKTDFGASYVRFCMSVCHVVSRSEMGQLRFVVCQKHPQCGLLDGKELALSQLSAGVSKVHEDLEALLATYLVMDFQSHLGQAFWGGLSSLTDNFLDRREKFWFGEHPLNLSFVHHWRGRFARHLTNIGFIDDKDFVDVSKKRMFYKKSEEFVKRLFWLLNVTGGGPARGSELCDLKYRNSRHDSRNIFIQQGRLMYVISGHKGREKLGGAGKPIARFNDIRTSNLLVLYLMFVRPTEDILQEISNQRHVSEHSLSWSSSSQLFSVRGKPIDYNTVLRSFQKVSTEVVGEKWNMRGYRQWHVGAVKNFINSKGRLDEAVSSATSTTLHEQTGHSTDTANRAYGVGELDMKRLDSVQLEVWRRGSYKWHSLLGLNNLESIRTEAGEPFKKHQPSNDNNNGAVGDNDQGILRIGTSVELLVKSIETIGNKVENVEKMISEIKGSSGVGIGVLAQCTTTPTSSNIPSTQAGKNPGQQLIEHLRKMLNNPKATFRSEGQRRSVTLSMSGERDGLYILPTGSGKTMIFMLIPFIIPTKMCIVIVPLVALQEDLVRKCQDAGVSAVLWDGRFAAGVGVVFCSCEHVRTKAYESFVKETCATGRLHAVFVDEAHLLVQWKCFRPVLGRLGAVIRPSGCHFKVHGLTATCPPNMEPTLIGLLALNNPNVVREDTSRGNISYRVRNYPGRELNFRVMELIGNLVTENAGKKEPYERTNKAIVYCLTREEVNWYHSTLPTMLSMEIRIFKYHAGMTKQDRVQNSDGWKVIDGKTNNVYVMVATSAFGCGIDVPNVRLVVHVKCPRSTIGFAQESGRGGRDGHPATSIVFNICDDKVNDGSSTVSAVGQDITPGEDVQEGGEKATGVTEDVMEMFSGRQFKMGRTLDTTFGSLTKWVLLKEPSCRRWDIEEYLNGKTLNKRTCFERGVQLCDICDANPDRRKRKYIVLSSGQQKDAEKGRRQSWRPFAPVPGNDAAFELDPIEDVWSDGTESPPKSTKVGPSDSQFMTPPVARVRRILQVETPGSRHGSSGTPSSVHLSQSQNVSGDDVLDLLQHFDKICAVCSIRTGYEIVHDNGMGPDDQSCDEYKGRCFKCASKYHRSGECFRLQFKNTSGWCHSCSFNEHSSTTLHRRKNYGTKLCEVVNSLRIVSVLFEDPEKGKAMKEAFPDMKKCGTNEELITWLRSSDRMGHIWLADVLQWVRSEVIPVSI